MGSSLCDWILSGLRSRFAFDHVMSSYCALVWILSKLISAWNFAGSQEVPGVVFSGRGIIVHERAEQWAEVSAFCQIKDTVIPHSSEGS